MFAKVFEAENEYDLQAMLDKWLKENGGIKIEHVSQSGIVYQTADPPFSVTTLVVFYTV